MGAGASTNHRGRPDMPIRELSRKLLCEIEQQSARAERRRRRHRRKHRHRRKRKHEEPAQGATDKEELLAIGWRCMESDDGSSEDSDASSDGQSEDEAADAKRVCKKYVREVMLDYLQGAMEFLFGE